MSNEINGCNDCGRPYGDEHGFPDLAIPNEVWRRISPTGNDGGKLCPSCICARLHNAGIRCECAFMSGPLTAVPPMVMWLHNVVTELPEYRARFGFE